MFGSRTKLPQVIAVAVGLGVVMVTTLAFRDLFWTLGAAILGVLGFVLAGRETREGESWIAVQSDRVTSWWAGRRGQSAWHPDMGLPVAMGAIREIAYSPDPARPEVAIGLLHQPAAGGAFGSKSTISAVLEVRGGGEGLRSLVDSNGDAEAFGRLLAALAARTSPVVQIDLETKVFPRHPGKDEAYFQSLLSPDCPPDLQTSMDELAAQVAAASEDYYSYVTITLSVKELTYREPSAAGDPEQLAELAAESLRVVIRRLQASGIEVRDVLNPAKLGAVIRNMFVPVFPLHATAEVTSAAEGFAWPYTATPDAVVVAGPTVTDSLTGEETSQWHHAVATIPPRGFPAGAVTGRWLAGLITDVQPSPIRTVKVQHRLVSKADMLRRTISRLTIDMADQRGDEKKGRISGGAAIAAADIRSLMLQDLQHEAAAGVQSQVHVLVSGRSAAELLQAKRQIEEAADNMGITALKWHRNKHHVAMLLTAPLGRWHG